MDKKSKMHGILYFIVPLFLLFCGCTDNSSATSNQNQREVKDITYIPQYVTLPTYDSFDGAYSNGSDLYFVAATFNADAGAYESTFYILKKGEVNPETLFTLPASRRLLNISMDADGNFYYIGYDEELQDNATPEISSDYTLYKLDPMGNPILILDLAEYTKEQITIQNLTVDKENRIILYTSNRSIIVLNSDGSKLFDTKADGMISDIGNSDGRVFIIYKGISGAEIKEVDIPNQTLSSKFECNLSGNRFYLTGTKEGNLLIATEEGLYQYTPELESITKRFDWQTYDITGISSGILLPYDENGLFAISRDYASYHMKTEVTIFREALEGESPLQEKIIITLGVSKQPATGIKAEIVNFNKNNPEYKIEIKNYDGDYTLLNTEIAAGNGPDLLMLPLDRIEHLAKKGIIEDLNPYLDTDKTLNRNDFHENILNAYMSDDKLFVIPIHFTIQTVLTKASVLDGMSAWTIDELISFAENAPDGMDIFDNSSKSGVLNLLKYANTKQLVDMNNLDAPLNRELLLKMLTFSNYYEDDEQYTYNINLYGKLNEKPVLLIDTELYAGQLHFVHSGVLQELATYIGYPSESGNGNLIHSNSTFAIHSGSEYKDVAWDLISTLLSKEPQMRMEKDYTTKGFHIRRDATEEHYSWILEGGTLGGILQPKSTEYYVQFLYSYKDLKEEHLEPIRNIIENADSITYSLSYIDQIIEEEVIFYFNGSKPVEEVVDVIENRIKTYVNETK